jgi:nucleoside phosphorylase
MLATLVSAGVCGGAHRQQAQMQAQDILRTAQVSQGDLELSVVTSGAVPLTAVLTCASAHPAWSPRSPSS